MTVNNHEKPAAPAPASTPAPAPSPIPEKRRIEAQRLLSRLKRNWPMKVIALVSAVVLWSALIAQDPSLTREKVFTDVSVTVSGSEALKRNALVVVSGAQELTGVTLRVEVPQTQYAAAQASAYGARVDLSRLREPGEQEVRILTSNSATYGTVASVEPETVTLVLEEYATRYRVPVNVVMDGSAPDGWWATAATADPPYVTVSGPRSLVSSVAQAEVRLNQADLPRRSGSYTQALSFVLKSSSGEVISSDLLEVTSESVLLDSINVEQTIYPQKEISLSGLGLVTGEPAEGYAIQSVTVSPASVIAAGSAEALERLEALYADAAVDVTGMTESFTRQMSIRRPSELRSLSQTTLTVAVEIGPVIDSRVFEGVRVSLIGVDNGLSSSQQTRYVDVTVTGPQLELNALSRGSLKLTCDAAGLGPGTYSLPIQCGITDGSGTEWAWSVQPETAVVVLE